MKSPLPLRLGAALVGVEVVLLLVVAILGLINPAHLGIAIGLAVLFVLVALMLGLAGIGLWEQRSWGRAPVVFAQLVMLGVAWDLHSGTLPISIAVLLVAAGVLGGVLHPASTRALASRS